MRCLDKDKGSLQVEIFKMEKSKNEAAQSQIYLLVGNNFLRPPAGHSKRKWPTEGTMSTAIFSSGFMVPLLCSGCEFDKTGV